jgi:hypothetical protein
MSNETHSTPTPQDLAEKVRALEEALAFQSHEHDQLQSHFLALTKALDACEQRVARLEQLHLEQRDPPSEE